MNIKIEARCKGDSILLFHLGRLHLRIRKFPLELLVRDPLVEDRPAAVRSNIKKSGQYILMKLSKRQ